MSRLCSTIQTNINSSTRSPESAEKEGTDKSGGNERVEGKEKTEQ